MALKTTGSLDNLTENVRTIFRNGCAALSDEERKILDFIALFYDGAPLAMISEYMHLNNLQVLKAWKFWKNRLYQGHSPTAGSAL